MKFMDIDPNSQKFYDGSWKMFLDLFRPNYFCGESTVVDVATTETINGKKYTNKHKMYWYDVPKLWDNDLDNRIHITFALTDYYGGVIADSISDKDKEEFIKVEVTTQDYVRFSTDKHKFVSKAEFSLNGDYCSFISDLIDLVREEDFVEDCDFEV